MTLRETEYVIFDVETTGLSPVGGDRIVEIAAVRMKNFEIMETFESLINPGIALPKEAQEINRITEEMIADAPTTQDALPRMTDFIGGGCLVGHNVKFDLDFLCYELSRMQRKLRHETPALDTLKMAKLLMPPMSSYRLANLAQSLGIRFEETHRALPDVKITAGVLRRLLMMAEERKIETFKDLHKYFGVIKPSFKMETIKQDVLF